MITLEYLEDRLWTAASILWGFLVVMIILTIYSGFCF